MESQHGIDESPFSYTRLHAGPVKPAPPRKRQQDKENFVTTFLLIIGTCLAPVGNFLLYFLPSFLLIATSAGYLVRRVATKQKMKAPTILLTVNTLILVVSSVFILWILPTVDIPDTVRTPVGYTTPKAGEQNIAYKYVGNQQSICDLNTSVCENLTVKLMGLTEDACPNGGTFTQSLDGYAQAEHISSSFKFGKLTKNEAQEFTLPVRGRIMPNSYLVSGDATITCN